jgi:hypothetical protein
MPDIYNLPRVDTTKRHYQCATCSLISHDVFSNLPCNDDLGHRWQARPAHFMRGVADSIYSDLSSAANSLGADSILASQLTERLLCDHRTLQQTVLGILKCMIEGYAVNAGSDLRNQEALDWAKKVLLLTQPPSRTLPGRFPLI